MTDAELAQVIAEAIAAQGVETDNLGDGESICFMESLPTLNLIELAETINAKLRG